MSEKDANTALECYSDRQVAERVKWGRVLAPVQPRKAQQKKSAWFWFFSK